MIDLTQEEKVQEAGDMGASKKHSANLNKSASKLERKRKVPVVRMTVDLASEIDGPPRERKPAIKRQKSSPPKIKPEDKIKTFNLADSDGEDSDITGSKCPSSESPPTTPESVLKGMPAVKKKITCLNACTAKPKRSDSWTPLVGADLPQRLASPAKEEATRQTDVPCTKPLQQRKPLEDTPPGKPSANCHRNHDVPQCQPAVQRAVQPLQAGIGVPSVPLGDTNNGLFRASPVTPDVTSNKPLNQPARVSVSLIQDPPAQPLDDENWFPEDADFSDIDQWVQERQLSKEKHAERQRSAQLDDIRRETGERAGVSNREGKFEGKSADLHEDGERQEHDWLDSAWKSGAKGALVNEPRGQQIRTKQPGEGKQAPRLPTETESMPAKPPPTTEATAEVKPPTEVKGKSWPPPPISGEQESPEVTRGRKKFVSERKKRCIIESESGSEEEEKNKGTMSKTKGGRSQKNRSSKQEGSVNKTVITCLLDSESDDELNLRERLQKKAGVKAKTKLPASDLKERVLRTFGKGSAQKAKPIKEDMFTEEDRVEQALKRLQRRVADAGQIVHVESFPARPAVHKEPKWRLHPKIAEALRTKGITQLYSHQADAISHLFDGSNLISATPTASGKSLTYCIPVLDAILNLPKARALLIFPTKALARDQLRAMRELIAVVRPGIACEQYDGDTPFEDRKQIVRKAQIIFTNPDMIHQSILQRHSQWKTFFSNLAFCVIDEAHHYKGAFGSHVGLVLRRLLRVAQHYGGTPQFICCSATINNPVEHVCRLISKVDTCLVEGSGAPVGPRHVMLWQPALAKDGDGKRKSAYIEAANIMVEMICAGLQTLVFVGARKLTEIVCNTARDMLKDQDRLDLQNKVESYRAGYSPEERRRLEKGLANGELRALVSTNALELGIDIGQLDCTIHVGLPDTMSSLWQQIGRAGRRQTSSLAVIIGRERPLDQHYLRHPKELFRRGIEDALCDPLNPYLLKMHLPCAANELPLTDEDESLFGPELETVRNELVDASELRYVPGPEEEDTYTYRWDDNPAAKFNIRGAAQDPYKVVDEKERLIEEVEQVTAFRRIHKGAVFLHQRDSFLVLELDVEKRRARVQSCSPEYMTEVKDQTCVRILETHISRKALAANLNFGMVKVVESIVGFQKKHVVSDKVIEEATLQLPPTEYDTCAIWWDVPHEVLAILDDSLGDALAGVKRMVISLLPQMSMMDRHDVGGLAVLRHEDSQGPQVFIFDAYPGGIGITKQAYGKIEGVWRQALTMLRECTCGEGCPGCVQPSAFESKEGGMAVKKACRLLLEALLADWMTGADTTTQSAAPKTGPLGENINVRQGKVAPLTDATNLVKPRTEDAKQKIPKRAPSDRAPRQPMTMNED